MKIRGVLLDIDGTFLDSNDAHATAYVQAMTEHGLGVPVARVRPLIGMGNDKLMPAIGIEPHSKLGKTVAHRKNEIFKERHIPTLKAFHGARDLVMHMKKLGLTATVATSSSKLDLRELLRIAKLTDLIDVDATSDDATASKPDPDILEAAIAKSKLPRQSLVMIGDTPYDIEAARRAEIPAIALRCGGYWKDRDLQGAAMICDDPADLLARFDSSPLGTHYH